MFPELCDHLIQGTAMGDSALCCILAGADAAKESVKDRFVLCRGGGREGVRHGEGREGWRDSMRGGVRTNRPFPFPVRALRGHEWCPYLDVGSQVGKQTRDGARGLKRVLGQCSHSCLYVWRWLPLGSVKCIVKVLRVRGKVWGRGGGSMCDENCVPSTQTPRAHTKSRAGSAPTTTTTTQ